MLNQFDFSETVFLLKVLSVLMLFSASSPLAAQLQEDNLFRLRSLSSFSETELDEVADDLNISKSLFAAWERMYRVATSPKPDNAVHDYISFLEKRLNLEVPDWWGNTITRTKFSEGSKLSVAEVQHSLFQTAGDNLNFQITKNFAIRQDSGQWYISGEESRTPLKGFNSSTLEISSANWSEYCLFLAVRPVGDELVVAFPSGDANPYRIIKLKNNGDICWESVVACRNPSEVVFERSGKLDDAVEVVDAGEYLVVFGICRDVSYLSGFQKDDGTEQFRFSTVDWCEYSGRKGEGYADEQEKASNKKNAYFRVLEMNPFQ